jgi:hypothetical protein
LRIATAGLGECNSFSGFSPLFAQFYIHGKRIKIIFTATDRLNNEKIKTSGSAPFQYTKSSGITQQCLIILPQQKQTALVFQEQ